MSYSLTISDRAILQIYKTAQWFFEQTPTLEKKFLLELDKAMDYIQKNPKKFDFGIHYLIEGKTVFVLSVFHTSQNSEDWF